MTLRSDLFQSNSLTGSVSVVNNFANVIFATAPYGLEGNINFVVDLKIGSETGSTVATSPTIKLVDYSSVVSFEPNSNAIYEGESVLFELNTNLVPNGSKFYYTVESLNGNVLPEDFITPISGNLTIVNNYANILLTTNNVSTTEIEIGEAFRLQLRTGSITGNVKVVSSNVQIIDVANLIGISSISISSNSIYETESVVFTVNAFNALGTNSATIFYTITGNADIFGNSFGPITIDNNLANLQLIAEASIPDGESREFAAQFRRDSVSGPVLLTSSNVIVRSLTGVISNLNPKISAVTSITSNTNQIFENQSVAFNINTQNSANGEVLYYNTLSTGTGFIDNSTFINGNTGSFVVNGNIGTVILNASNAVYNDTFKLQVTRSNVGSTILGSSNTITYVGDPGYIQATGGNVEIDGNFKIHVFTTSDNLTVSSLSLIPSRNTIEYLVVAGGGGGGRGRTGNHLSGGGGAGGMLASNTTITQATAYVVTVGAGGQFGSAVQTAGTGGSSSIVAGPINISTTGGGRGDGSGNQPAGGGSPGGSGGGGNGAGITGQGFPGAPGTAYGGGGGAGTAGGTGGGPSFRNGGVGRVWPFSPPAYGTTGPAPGRYFAGGGAGGSDSSPTQGGAGGGGNTGENAPFSPTPGVAGTGGGGGGGSIPTYQNGGNGGPGIVMIRYRYQ